MFLFSILISVVFAMPQKPVKEVQLDKVKTVTDGFCAMELVDLLESNQRFRYNRNLPAAVLKFIYRAQDRATKIYLTSDIGYTSPQEKVNVRSYALFNSGKFSGVQMNLEQGDESQVRFYFRAAYDEGGAGAEPVPKLILAIHNEQSAQAYWVCE